MNCIEVLGGKPLCGSVRIQGSKNAALPIIAACVLHAGVSVLHNCPKITDVEHMIQILEHIGCSTAWQDNTLTIDASSICTCDIPKDAAGKMRSSVIMLGSMLGRCGATKLSYPGGCVIGKRPIDIHLEAFRKMGVTIEEESELLKAHTEKLTGNTICLNFPSVGATENILLASVLADGVTQIINCAKEPEIVDLCNFLNAMGANIRGAGTSVIYVKGVKKLHDAEYTISPDRIVAGTYLLAAAAVRGNIILEDTAPADQMESLYAVLNNMGGRLKVSGAKLQFDGRFVGRGAGRVETYPHPGFPTDLQSQLMAAACVQDGKTIICENIFEARFKIAEELQKMGAHIKIDGKEACILGGDHLKGNAILAKELRGGAALIIAGMCAKGVTRIGDIEYIYRGYEDIVRDLTSLGAEIRIV